MFLNRCSAYASNSRNSGINIRSQSAMLLLVISDTRALSLVSDTMLKTGNKPLYSKGIWCFNHASTSTTGEYRRHVARNRAFDNQLFKVFLPIFGKLGYIVELFIHILATLDFNDRGDTGSLANGVRGSHPVTLFPLANEVVQFDRMSQAVHIYVAFTSIIQETGMVPVGAMQRSKRVDVLRQCKL